MVQQDVPDDPVSPLPCTLCSCFCLRKVAVECYQIDLVVFIPYSLASEQSSYNQAEREVSLSQGNWRALLTSAGPSHACMFTFASSLRQIMRLSTVVSGHCVIFCHTPYQAPFPGQPLGVLGGKSKPLLFWIPEVFQASGA